MFKTSQNNEGYLRQLYPTRCHIAPNVTSVSETTRNCSGMLNIKKHKFKMQTYKLYTLILTLRFKKSKLLAFARLNPGVPAYFSYSKVLLF